MVRMTVRETQVKAAMAVTSGNHQDGGRVQGRGHSPSCTARVYSSAGAMGGVGVPQNTQHRAALQAGNPASGTSPEEIRNAKSQRHRHPYAHCGALHSQDAEGTQVSRRVNRYGRRGPSPHGMLASHEEQGHPTTVTARKDLEDTAQREKPDTGQMPQEATETRSGRQTQARRGLGPGTRPPPRMPTELQSRPRHTHDK